MEGAKHRVIGVAGVAGVISGNKIVLEMRGGNVTGIVHVKAPAKIMHYVAREAKFRAGGTFHMFGVAQSHGHYWQNEKSDEGQNFSATDSRELGASSQ
jgi:hypothetical protein